MESRYERFKNYAYTYKMDSELPCAIFRNQIRNKVNRSVKANWHKELEIQYFIRGEGYVIIDGERFDVSAGDMVVANSECVHYTGSDTEIEYSAMIIDSDFCLYSDIDFTAVTFQPKIQSERIETFFSDIVAVYGENARVCKKARVQAALLRLLIELREFYVTSNENNKRQSNAYHQVKKAIQYIRNNYAEKLSLDILAQNALVDKYSLSRNFKAITGQTIVEYINNYRCDRAKELIKNGTHVNEAAISCGFSNMSFFTKTFKKYAGVNPSEYKNK